MFQSKFPFKDKIKSYLILHNTTGKVCSVLVLRRELKFGQTQRGPFCTARQIPATSDTEGQRSKV